MELHIDVHSHSVFAGGAGAASLNDETSTKKMIKRFDEINRFSPLKGINLLGTGDITFSKWKDFIQTSFTEKNDGFFSYDTKNQDDANTGPDYVLQTELIFTGPVPNSNYKKRVHVLFLFPDFASVDTLVEHFDNWQVSHQKMARPFIVCQDSETVSDRINSILDIHPLMECIPAHIMTPEGVYGGNHRINHLEEFFGEVKNRFHAVETGLSADPLVLGLVPELDNMTLLSNADAHSGKLNRVGREFTTLKVNKTSYRSLINAIRINKVLTSAEFHPTEGRYFLTGHRAGRKKPGTHLANQFCYFSPTNVPASDICPQCNKELTIGVFQRAYEICDKQGEDRRLGDVVSREYVTMIPLIEIIAKTLNIKSITSKQVYNTYLEVIKEIGSEINLWTESGLENKLSPSIPQELIQNIVTIKKGNFSFLPPGFDGEYGELVIGSEVNFEDLSLVSG